MMNRIAIITFMAASMLVGCEKEDSVEASQESLRAEMENTEAPVDDEVPGFTEEELSWIPAQPDDMEPIQVQHVQTAGQAARGASADEALVTIVEVGDYGCPDTEARRDLVEALLDDYGEDVRYVYLNVVWVPGAYGPFAANLATAAAQNDQYWKAHDIIWKRFRKLDEYEKESYLEPLGLTLKDLQAARTAAKKRSDANQTLAGELNVQWVPTFFVNGVPLVKLSDDEVDKFVRVQREKARQMQQENGLSGAELYEAMVDVNRAAVE